MTGRPTTRPPGRGDVRPSPSDASRVGRLRCPGSQTAPKKWAQSTQKPCGKKCQKKCAPWAKECAEGASRDQPQEKGASSDGNPSENEGSPGVGHGLRPLAKAGTAQRGEWPRSPASSGGHGARGGTPGRGLALPGPAGEWAKKPLSKRRTWPRGIASAGRRRSRRPALTSRVHLITRSAGTTGNLAHEFTPDSTPDTDSG